MTDKQRKFCDEYLIDANATRAYKAAYPHVKSEDAARACASRLLTNANIKSYIDEQLEKTSSDKIADAKEVMEYLTSVLRGESQSEIVIVEGCGDGVSQAVTKYKKPSMKDVISAVDKLAKMQGLYNDNSMMLNVVPVFFGEDELED